MTIEYKDSKRIVALEADVSKNIVTINHRCSTTDDHAYADLGSALSNTSWVMRYKMVISGYSASSTNPNNAYLFAISQTTANNMVDQSLGLKMRIGGGSGYSDFFVGGGTSSQNNAEGYEGSLFSSQTTANGTWYVEYIRNGSSFSIRLTTSSDYTGGELDTWSTSGTVENLRYIKYTNRDDNTSSHVCVCTISDIKIYDGVTSATGTFVRDGTWTASASNKVTVALEANKPTDVQDNTILVEKDTAKRYWFESELAPTEVVSGFTISGTSGKVSESSGTLSFTVNSSSQSTLAVKALSANAGSSYVLRYKLTVTTDDIAFPAGQAGTLTYGTSSATSGFSEDPPTSSYTIYVKHALHADKAANYSMDGSSMSNDWNNGISNGSGARTKYVEVINNAGSMTIRYTDSDDYTGGLVTPAWSAASGAQSGVKGNIFFNFATQGVASGSFVGTVSDVKLYNNVTSVTPATWIDPSTWIRALFMGGNTTTYSSAIDYITIDNKGNSSSFGDLTQARWELGGASDSTRAVAGGGLTTGTTWVNTMDYVTIATAGNATDFGDLTYARRSMSGCSNDTRGIFSGGRLS